MSLKSFSQEIQDVKDEISLLSSVVDYAKGIAQINIRSGGLSLPCLLRDIYFMAKKQ